MASRRKPPRRTSRVKATEVTFRRLSRGRSRASIPRRNVFFGDPRITGHRRNG